MDLLSTTALSLMTFDPTGPSLPVALYPPSCRGRAVCGALDPGMSGSTSPPRSAETAAAEGCFPPGYKPFRPEEHGLERGFRLTAFSDLKG
ncbi:hypothetical protein EYF80_063703 [Liparis tanakae]|uniref:Uncharacterized protein n=1 Tax=Liparis tanakae TaxID=230148 RepID=A0A4Z2EC61_9TELE|nr:hypothetical protein EYF80_063703 [Liparis tanakae]